MTFKKNDSQAPTKTEQVTTFTFNPINQAIRVEIINNQAWFVAKDVCDVLEHTNVSVAMRMLDDDERAKKSLGSRSNEDNWLVNESGLYNLIFRSNKPEARAFRRWVTSELLPGVRRGGAAVSLPKGVKEFAINGQTFYAFAEMARALGYTSGGGLYEKRRRYPAHFINVGKLAYVSRDMALYIAASRKQTERRKELIASQPAINFNFEKLPALPFNKKGGNYGTL